MPDTAEKNQEHINPLSSGKQTIDTFGVLIFFVIVIEIVLIFGLNLFQKSRIETLTDQLSTKKQTLNSDEYRTLNTQIDEVLDGQDTLASVLNGKVKWASFYSMLNTVTPKNVTVTELSIAEGGSFRAEGQTASLSSLARALTAWQKGTNGSPTPFAAITLNSNGFFIKDGQRLVSFSVSGMVNTGLLK